MTSMKSPVMRALPPPADAADRIVHATLACIEQDGIDGLTVRAIACAAGVNIAAINYYFRSKEQLVALALERMLDHGVRDPLSELERLLAAGKELRAALVTVLDTVLADAIRFPRAAFAHLHGPIVLQDYRRDVVVRTNAFLERLYARIRTRVQGRGDAQKRAALAQLWSAVQLTTLAPSLLRPFTRLDLRDAKKRRAWITALVDRAITSVEPAKPRRAGGARGSGRGASGRSRARRRA
jgi:AcrR family transcriptional regulator